MSKKIIGVTVGTTLPKPNFKQTDPTKGDYIKNKPDFEGLRTDVNDIKTLVGDTSVSDQISGALYSLDLIRPLSDEDGSLSESDETLLAVRNDDIFLPEVTAENDGGVLKVVDGKWTVGNIEVPEVPEINYPVTSVNGQTGDVVIDTPAQVQADWNQTDETAADFIKNKPKEPTEEDALLVAMETGLIEAIPTASNEVLVDKNNTVITL